MSDTEPLLNSVEQEPVKKPRRIKVLKSKLQEQEQSQRSQPRDATQEHEDRTKASNSPDGQDVSKLTIWQALKMDENQDTRQVLGRTTGLMAIIPLSVFFLTRYLIFKSTEFGGTYTENQSLTYAGICAVIAVNCVSFGFVIFASCVQRDERLDPEWLDAEVTKAAEQVKTRLVRETALEKLQSEAKLDMRITPAIPTPEDQQKIKEYYLSHANLAEKEYQEKKNKLAGTGFAPKQPTVSSQPGFDIGDDETDAGNIDTMNDEQSEMTKRKRRGKSPTRSE